MLTIYAPFDNPNSKCWEVFKGVERTWPEPVKVLDNARIFEPLPNAMFWGFVNNNGTMIHKLESRAHDYWFTDAPYFGRFDNDNLKPDNHYWRICRNNIHVEFIKDCKPDRLQKFKIQIKSPARNGAHILICPSSSGVHKYLKQPDWLNNTIEENKKYTDRPVKIRYKPKGKGTSGPAVAKVPIEEDLKNAWVCVTSCSMSAIEAIFEGIPVFCHQTSFATPVACTDLKHIENPFYTDPYPWLCSLAYQQFTPAEYANGSAVKTLRNIGLLTS
jgi:hypothetical protein